MPPINHVAVTAGLAAVSVAVAAAVAIYESDEVRRYTEQLRRRIAVALHSLGNELDPSQTRNVEPLFNRPEDAEGFLMSTRGEGGVDADEETRKRQRDELMYWNAIRESKLEAQRSRDAAVSPAAASRSRGASFDDFLKPDTSAEDGAFVVNTGADTNRNRDGLTRRNVGAAAGVTGLSAGMHANPFSDDQGMGDDEAELARTMLAPGADEMSDIYSSSTPDHHGGRTTPPASASSRPREEALIDMQSESSTSTVSRTLDFEREGSVDGQAPHALGASQSNDRENLFAVIGAWADATDAAEQENRAHTPSTPTSASFSHLGGQLTPDDGFSLAGGDEEVDAQHVEMANGAASEAAAEVRSISEGVFTPASWSELGSTVSESEPDMRPRA